MKINTFIALSATVLGVSMPSIAQASSLYSANNRFWNKTRWVTVTKKITVHKIRNMVPAYKSYSVADYEVDRGAHYKLDHWGNSYPWGFESGNFKSNRKYTYVILNQGHSWFVLGKKTLDPHKLNLKPKDLNIHYDTYMTSRKKETFYASSPYSKKHKLLKPGTIIQMDSTGTTNNHVKWYDVTLEDGQDGWVRQRDFHRFKKETFITAQINSLNNTVTGKTRPYGMVYTSGTKPQSAQADKYGNYTLSITNNIFTVDDNNLLTDRIDLTSHSWGYTGADKILRLSNKY